MTIQFVPANNRLVTDSFLALLVLYLVFIGFASFYLTGSGVPDLEDGLGRLFRSNLATFRPSFHNLRDVVTNILLYIPLGFLAACLTYQLGWKSRRSLLAGLLAGVFVSAGVECIQAFVGRYSDLADIVSNSFGHATGYLLVWVAIGRYGLNPATLLGMEIDDDGIMLNTLLGIRFIYLLLVFFVSLLPFTISVSLNDLLLKLQPAEEAALPLLVLNPFLHFSPGAGNFQGVFAGLLVYVPFTVLNTWILHLKQRDIWLFPAIYCLVLALCLESAKLFIINARSDILLLLLAPLVGFLVSVGFRILITGSVSTVATGGALASVAQDTTRQAIIISHVLFFYGLFLASWYLSPYDFETSSRAIQAKLLNDSNLLPFRLHFSTRSVGSAIDIVRETILFLPVGLLLGMLSARLQAGKSFHIAALMLVVFISVSFELLQLLVVGRFADITDSLLGVFGAIAGFIIHSYFVRYRKINRGNRGH